MQSGLLQVFYREKEPLDQGWTSVIVGKAVNLGNQVSISLTICRKNQTVPTKKDHCKMA